MKVSEKMKLREEAWKMVKHGTAEQRERYQRGEAFQEEVRRSWRKITGSYRVRIKDGGGGTRPADELIILTDINVMAELKRTAGDRFELSFLEVNQGKGLMSFDSCNRRNFGLVFVSFQTMDLKTDEAYAFRLLEALAYMKLKGRQYITMEELAKGVIPTAWLPRLQLTDGPGYDLKGVELCFKFK